MYLCIRATISYVNIFPSLMRYLEINARTSAGLTGIENTIIRNARTANDINLIYINRTSVPETNSPFRFIQLPFNFIDGSQKIPPCNVVLLLPTLSQSTYGNVGNAEGN